MVQSKTCSGENVSDTSQKCLGSNIWEYQELRSDQKTYNIQSFVISKDLKMNHKTHRHFHKILVH